MKRLLREPLFHFLLLGAAIFVAYGLGPRRSGDQPVTIVVTRGQIEAIAAGFARVRQRPPSADELADLIRDRIREEVLCREATALGLGQDDTVIRHRLRQKMEFVSEEIAGQTEPTDAELDAYLRAHADAFLVFVDGRTEGRLPELAEVRDAVRRQWDESRRLEANERFYQELLKRYTVIVEQSRSTTEQGTPVTSR
jgi:hypothetical protein